MQGYFSLLFRCEINFYYPLVPLSNQGMGTVEKHNTNDTWKLEDLAGNPLYNMRYYNCGHKKDYFFFLNADNEMCLMNQYGEK